MDGRKYVDGGLLANNPSRVAFRCAYHLDASSIPFGLLSIFLYMLSPYLLASLLNNFSSITFF